MSFDQLIARAQAGNPPSVCVLTGSERLLVERATAAIKQAAVGDGPGGFNDDLFQGQGLSAQRVIQAARTMPMMASRRFVLVRNLDAVAAAEQELLAD